MTNKLKLLPSIWAIHPDELAKVEQVYVDYTKKDATIEALDTLSVLEPYQSGNIEIVDNIGILKIEGVIVAKSDIFTEIFGGAALDQLTDDFKSLVDNDEVDTIVLDIDSPGGTVEGVATFANMVFEARDEKRIFAHSSSIMTSAAIWIGSAAEKILISDNTVTTGSIGVLTTHIDFSVFNEKLGIKPTEITAGAKKRVASQLMPLTIEGRAVLQGQVDHLMDVFVGDVARFKGISAQNVSVNMADGEVFIGIKGVEAGLIDYIISFDLLIQTISNGGNDMSIFAKNVEANLQNLKEHHTDVYNEAVAIGVAEANQATDKKAETAEKTGYDAGAKAERERINGIDACTIAGQEKLAAELKADGSVSPGDAAIKMINADKAVKANGLDAIKKESAKAISDEVEETIVKKVDQTPKQAWEASADLQKEFPDVAVYESYIKNNADGNIRVFSQNAR